jgi:alkylhydroperoxidase family enzyme
MARLPYLDLSDAAPDVRAALERLPPLNILRMTAHAQSAVRPWLALGGALLATLELDPVRRELAILQVARLTQAEYEWVQHEAIALGVGVTPAQVQAVRAGRVADPSLDPGQQAVLAFAAEVVERRGGCSPEAVQAILDHGSERQVVELILLVGYYQTVAALALATGIETDEPSQMAIVEASQRGEMGRG